MHKFETITFKKGKIRPASGLRSGLLIILTGKIQTVINMMADGDGIVNTFVRVSRARVGLVDLSMVD